MLIPDVNVLLYASDETARHHDPARRWVEASLSGDEPVGFCWAVLVGFVRIATNPRVYDEPLSAEAAIDEVDAWLVPESATIVEPGRRHLEILRGLLAELGTAGNLVSDAHLAALAIERKATLVSFDNDFSRFPNLRWFDPGRAAR